MAIQILLLLFLSIFKVESYPTKIFQTNQLQTKSYEAFKDILIQNLIVTTDNLKLILNMEREDTYYKVRDEDKLNTKLINFDVIPKQNDLWNNFKGDNNKVTTINTKNFKKRSTNVPGEYKTQELIQQDDNVEKNAMRQDSKEYSPIKSEEHLLNYANSDSVLFDDVSYFEKTKRQASDDSVLPIQGDGDTQNVMGTFQAAMRPMKLPSLS